MKSKVLLSLFETVRLSVSISPRNPYNSLEGIKELFTSHLHIIQLLTFDEVDMKCYYPLAQQSCGGDIGSVPYVCM